MPSPRRSARTLTIAAALLLGLAFLAAWLLLSMPGTALRADIVEHLTGETPEARIDAYVRAVLSGGEQAAYAAWDLPDWNLPAGRSARLATRRQQVTRDLLAAGIQRDPMIVHIEWWRTCCEPGPICNPREAGGARIRVQFLDQEGQPFSYTFDLFTLGGAYWGGAMGYPARQWALRDIYPDGEEPLFWRLAYEPKVRSLDALTPDAP